MTYEEKANTDKLIFYFQEKIAVHIILKRKLPNGKNVFSNGFLIGNPTDRLWIIDDRVDGKTNISISEIVARSEERRVGKECRSRWSPDH